MEASEIDDNNDVEQSVAIRERIQESEETSPIAAPGRSEGFISKRARYMMSDLILTRYQAVGGKAISGLGVRDIAANARMSPTAISQFMTGRTSQPHDTTLEAIRMVLQSHEVQFAPGGWVRRLPNNGNLDVGAPELGITPVHRLESHITAALGILPMLSK